MGDFPASGRGRRFLGKTSEVLEIHHQDTKTSRKLY
jgi:hypothetical protein